MTERSDAARASDGPAPSDAESIVFVADECLKLVAADFGGQLDWSLASLDELDRVCASLIAKGPLTGERLELW
jgi:hypothetical protein